MSYIRSNAILGDTKFVSLPAFQSFNNFLKVSNRPTCRPFIKWHLLRHCSISEVQLSLSSAKQPLSLSFQSSSIYQCRYHFSSIARSHLSIQIQVSRIDNVFLKINYNVPSPCLLYLLALQCAEHRFQWFATFVMVNL